MAPVPARTPAPATVVIACWLLTGLVPGDRGSHKQQANASREPKKSAGDGELKSVQVGTASLIQVHLSNQTKLNTSAGDDNASLTKMNLVNETQLDAEAKDTPKQDAEAAARLAAVQATGHQHQATRASTKVRDQPLETPLRLHVTPPVAKVMMLPQDLQDDVARKVAHMFGVQAGAECTTEGDAAYIGCSTGCKCGWGRTCYKRYMYVDENIISESLQQAKSNSSDESTKNSWGVARVNLGTCELATPVLVTISLLAFSLTLSCVIGWRMYLQAHSLYMSDMHYATDTSGIKVMWPDLSPVLTRPEDLKAVQYPDMDDDDLNMTLEPPTDRRGTVLNKPA